MKVQTIDIIIILLQDHILELDFKHQIISYTTHIISIRFIFISKKSSSE